MKKAILFIFMLFTSNFIKAQNPPLDFGINLTGFERYWDEESWHYKDVINNLDELYNKGIRDIRLPVAFEYQFSIQSRRHFLRNLVKIIKHAKKKNMTIILCYFDHTLEKNSKFTNVNTLKNNWSYIANKLKKYSDCVYYEILNEPNLYPDQWSVVANAIVSEIRKEDEKTKILIGATNYNSIYELSRKTPFPYQNIIYIFHFYEPFLFTHQGAEWIGDQVKTTNIPYPYDSLKMPEINLKTIKTPGEVNYNDYKDMSNKTSLGHKIDIVVEWSKKHNVELWCTEFGTIKTIPKEYRCNYFKDVIAVFREKNIKCYLWEYKGNFGIYNNNNILECL